MNESTEHKKNGKYFLGIDLGSSFTKFVVIDESGKIHYNQVIMTRSRNRDLYQQKLQEIYDNYSILCSCATGYGRKQFDSDLKKTELICAAAGASALFPVEKGVIDIGGEDIKIIECGPAGEVRNFYMNDKCSAGTGAFITEIAEKAEMEIAEMNELAVQSRANRVINSFCTVFAKTEILGWKFDGVPIEDIARGIYLSIVKRICKMPIPAGLPLYLCGGVIAYHPLLKELLAAELDTEISVFEKPQFTVAFGAAILAKKQDQAAGERRIGKKAK